MLSATLPTVPAPSAPLESPRRARRVVILLIGFALLGLGDLYATIAHATSIGMFEVNPIGAYLIGENNISGLILFKLGSMGVAIAALLAVRSHPAGEWTSWLLVAVMAALTLHWYQYNMEVAYHLATTDYHAMSQQLRLEWVRAGR